MSRPTVLQWRNRYAHGGLEALEDRPRSGTAASGEHGRDRGAHSGEPAGRAGVTHWSSRLLAKELEIGNATVARAWRDWDIQPWRVESFKFFTDPQLEAKSATLSGCA